MEMAHENRDLQGAAAWALLGLIAAGEGLSPEVARGVDYLLGTQRPDGNWDEEPFTGTGFPKVFYLKYHLYRLYFPLMALARYARVTGAPLGPEVGAHQGPHSPSFSPRAEAVGES